MFYGAQYYRPPFPYKQDWERDFANMQDYGFNCVKLWAVWNWIEKEPGKFEFDDLDELVVLAKRYNLAVIINMIPEGAPYWTYDGRKELLYQTADGQHVHYGGPANLPSGGWPGLCMDHGEFAALTADFIEKTAAHFAGEPAVAAIDVWNEPHLEPMYDYRSNMLCYCDNTQNKFRSWLKDKYRTLAALNKAWYRTYLSWEEVTPPPRFGTWADMIDWRRFWLDNMRDWLRLRVAAARKGAPDIPVQTHVAYSGILGNRLTGGLANELGDEFMLAGEVDYFGLSSFPKWLMGEEHRYRHLLHSEMVASASGRKLFYQVELQGGAGKPGLLGGEVPTGEDVCCWNYNTIVTGGKGSVYWQYTPEPAGVESPGFGLTGFKGEETPRSRAAGECARSLNLEPLNQAERVLAVNAVYVSRDSSILCFAAGRQDEMYAGSLSGIFKAGYEAGIPLRYLHQDQLEELVYPAVEILYLPMPLVLSAEERQAFGRYLLAGGTIVSEAGPGLYRPDGLLDQESLALAELFGLEHVEIQGLKDWGEVEVTGEAGIPDFTGRFYRQLIRPLTEVTVLGRFADGEAAVTERRVGKGKAVFIGTYPSYHYEQTRQENNSQFLCHWLSSGGYAQLKSIKHNASGDSEVALAPVVRLLKTDQDYILTAVNHCEQPVEVTVEFHDDLATEPVHLTLQPAQLKYFVFPQH